MDTWIDVAKIIGVHSAPDRIAICVVIYHDFSSGELFYVFV
jgi:hypothetical protein